MSRFAIVALKNFVLFSFCLSLTQCSTKSNPNMASEEASEGSPFDPSLSGDLYDSLGGSGNSSGTVGSGTGGGLTEADKTALSNVTDGMNAVNTAEGGLSQSLIDEAQRILDQEANTDGFGQSRAQIQAAKMALVGKILEECAAKIAPLAPAPGQPLMGVWKGGGACPVEFKVSAVGSGQPVYAVTGGTKGTMAAFTDGHGEVKADPFSGSLTDLPQAGTGKLVHPTFHKTKSGTNPCEVGVQLTSSTNPIPENYVEAMKRAGKCHRQALLFMSPVMDKMFKSMPSSLNSILMNRAIGVAK